MKLQYHPAEPADIPVIFSQAKALIDTYEDVHAIAYDRVLAWVEGKIKSQLGSYCRVVSDGSTCAYFRLCEDGELDDFYVLPAYQGQGIGSEILKKCIAESKKGIYLYVFCRNIRAISFYERFGFKVRESVGGTRLIMARNG